MSEKLVLSIDCGTQSCRAMLYDAEGTLVAKVKKSYPPYKTAPQGICEQDADLYWDKICEAINEVKAANPVQFERVAGVTLTCMRDVGVCVDKDMKPLRPAILWLDTRKAGYVKLPLHAKLMFAVSGMTEIVKKKTADCKSNWIQQNEPEIWAKTYKYLQLSAYLTYKLTGNIIDSAASTVGHIPFCYKKSDWYKDKHYMSSMFFVGKDRLYPLAKPGDTLGGVTEDAAKATGIKSGLPVIASGSDKSAETIGTGAIEKDAASISFGTTSTMQLTTKHYVEPLKFMPPYLACYPDRYNPEYIIYRGYWMLTWFVEQFMGKEKELGKCVEAGLDKELDTIPPGCNGLYLQPYWNPGIKSPEARGAIIGFDNAHTAMHLYRAIIEGINYELIFGLRNLEKNAKVKVTHLTASGGGAASDAVLQITADMFGLPITRVQTFETSGLGAAICAFVGLKEFECFDCAIKAMVHEGKTFTPNMEANKFYAKFYDEVYKVTYKRLKPIYKILKEKYKK